MKGPMKLKKAVEAFKIKESVEVRSTIIPFSLTILTFPQAASGCSQKLDTIQVHAKCFCSNLVMSALALIMTTTFIGSVMRKVMINAMCIKLALLFAEVNYFNLRRLQPKIG